MITSCAHGRTLSCDWREGARGWDDVTTRIHMADPLMGAGLGVVEEVRGRQATPFSGEHLGMSRKWRVSWRGGGVERVVAALANGMRANVQGRDVQLYRGSLAGPVLLPQTTGLPRSTQSRLIVHQQKLPRRDCGR